MTSSAKRPHSPVLDQLGVYPFVQLAEVRAERVASGKPFYDFSVGEPREGTPEFLRQALAAAIPEQSSYPPTAGVPELRTAIAGWIKRRYAVDVDPEREVLVSSGSKESLYSIHATVLDRTSDRQIVWVPELAYPVYEIGARMAGAEVRHYPLHPGNGFRPDFSVISKEDWDRTALLWINSPNNPTGVTMSLPHLAETVALAREHGFWLASDEAYTDLYFGEAPPSALQCGLENVLTFHTTSKRSAMAGFRSGFMAGDPELVGWLKKIRPSQGIASPTFVQAAAVAAWSDDEHAANQRRVYAKKRDRLLDLLRRKELDVLPTEASLFLFFATPTGTTESEFVAKLLQAGIGVVGSRALGPASLPRLDGPGWIRLALVPTLEECESAIAILEDLL